MKQLGIFIFSILTSWTVFAEDLNLETVEDEAPRIVAITSRPYVLNKEIGFYYSYLPLDHFNHFQVYGANYQTYFNDYLAWEVLNFGYVTATTTRLEQRLIDDFGALPEESDVLKNIYSTSLVYTPIYMKHLVHNSSIKYGDLSFIGGFARGEFEKNGNINMAVLGFSNRFVGQEGLNIKLDVRYLQPLGGNVRSNLSIGIVFSYNFIKNSEKEIEIRED